jgi:hypothetical protein
MAIFACAPPEVATRFGDERPCVHTSVMNRQADVCNIFVVSLSYLLETDSSTGAAVASTPSDAQAASSSSGGGSSTTSTTSASTTSASSTSASSTSSGGFDPLADTPRPPSTGPVRPLHNPTQALCFLSQWPVLSFLESVLRRIYGILLNARDGSDDSSVEALLAELQRHPILPPLPSLLGGFAGANDTRTVVRLRPQPKRAALGDEVATLPVVQLRQANESPVLPFVDRQCFECVFLNMNERTNE